jgi:hypothetical protein
MNLKIVYLAAARYAKEDLLNVENTKFPAVAEFFRPILDLFRLPVNSNFPVYIWITYIFHVMYSILLERFYGASASDLRPQSPPA